MTAALSWTVVLAVLFGALLHAGWNAALKASADKPLDNALIHATATALALPLLAWAGPPPAAAWPYVIASAAIHLGYHVTLTQAYAHGDLGLTYPLMRGAAPLGVALASGPLLGEPLAPAAWLGVAAVCAGVVALGVSARATRHGRAAAWALANASIIALYTLIDGQGVRAAGDALPYVLALFSLQGWPFALLVFRRRGWRAVRAHARSRWPWALGGAVATIGAYGVALWAMTRAPVAAVAALRETSVLFAVLLGCLWLGERFTARRAAAVVLIVAGIVALRLA